MLMHQILISPAVKKKKKCVKFIFGHTWNKMYFKMSELKCVVVKKSETEAATYRPFNAQLAPFKAQRAKLGHTL